MGIVVLLAVLGCPAQQDDRDPAGDPPNVATTRDSVPVSATPSEAIPPVVSQRAWADWPVENVAPSGWFGWRLEPSGEFTRSPGLRFATAANSYVLAIADGTVREIRTREDRSFEVVVDHAEGIESRYAPLGASLVYAGMPVNRGTTLGFTAGAELGLEVWAEGHAVDPLLVLRSPLSLP